MSNNSFLTSHRYISVSYTHLDVYKRQEIRENKAIGSDSEDRENISNSSDEENIMGVDVSEGVVIRVHEVEREWRES